MTPLPLHRDPAFRALWAAQAVSRFGTHITAAALAVTAVIVLRATPAQVGLLGALEGLPLLLLGLAAGVWVDRVPRRPVLIATDLARALLLLWIPIGALLGGLRIEHLYVIAGLTGLLTVFFDVADRSFLPAVVPREALVEANSRLSASESVAEIAGPSLAGGLIQWLGAPVAVLIDCATYVFSAACVARIRVKESRAVPAPGVAGVAGVREELREGLRTVWGSPVLRSLAAASAGMYLGGGMLGATYWLLLVREYGLGPALVGLSIGVGGVGSLSGAAYAGWLRRRLGVGPALGASRLMAAFLAGLMGLVPGHSLWTAPVILALQLFNDGPWAVYIIQVRSLEQAVTPERLLGRVGATMDVLGRGLSPAGALAAGLLAERIGLRATWVLGAVLILLTTAPLLAPAIRRLRELPGGQGGVGCRV